MTTVPHPDELRLLGRGVVVTAGAPVPSAWADAPVITVDDAALGGPGSTLAELHGAWSSRTPVVVVLSVDPVRLRTPPELRVEPHTLDADLTLPEEELQFLVWANTYDGRGDGAPVWWWGRKAQRLGAGPAPGGQPGDVVLADGTPAWVDGGPRRPWSELPAGLAVLHRESVERGRLVAFSEPVARRHGGPGGPDLALAPDQAAAVAHLSGPSRIIAPAGSGKTRVLTARLRHLVVERGWERDSVLAVAYNKKAQQEMESRCSDFAPRTRTLNSLGLWVLTEERGAMPLVLGERDVRRIVDSLAPSRRHRANTDPIGPYIEALGRVRMALVDPEQVESERDDVPGLPEVFAGFRRALFERGAVDFDEQVYGAIGALLADGALRQRLQVSCRHLLVDEFQDLTPAHVLLLRLLAGPAADVFGVGDDDQVIYGHAGADPAFLIDYATLFPGAADHPLEVNHRCPPAVVAAASSLLSYNHRRVPKVIRAGRAVTEGAPPAIEVLHPTPGTATTALAATVGGWLDGGAAPADVAVLARVRAALLAPVVALAAAGIPVDTTLGPEVLERTGLRAALAYLRLATSGGTFAATDVAEILRRPSRGLPPWVADRLRRRSTWSRGTLGGLGNAMSDKDAAKLDRLVDDLASLTDAAGAGADAASLLAVVRDDVGLGGAMGLLDASSGGEGSSHLDDLEALMEVAALHPDPSGLEGWLRDHLGGSGGGGGGGGAGGGGVTCSTVHRVKGLEWDLVAVTGVTAGLLPHRLADDDEEERRILHVAITRARHRVVLLADASRPSPFVAELDGTAPHRPATAPAGRGAAGSSPAGERHPGRRSGPPGAPGGSGRPAGPRQVEARAGLELTVAGGFTGTVGTVDADGAAVALASGARIRVLWGETVTVHGRDAVLVAPADLPSEVLAVEEALRAWRSGRARSDRVAPFIVFHDKVLRAIALARPSSLAALRAVDGVGPTKLDSYGEELLDVVAGVPGAVPVAVGAPAEAAAPPGAPPAHRPHQK